ncbi:MoxR family ATPase [Petroclostridium sp. X23]|uniref:AAA family ATPase n=1 Tax=Petroclostridium sp. X23 TaxID=3045146 RepID=UPI0024ADC3A2|nr:MoxR family ATPase [Petroclostridium sp. X23]WHH60294.1 MoxR family ATPase [Petroclostridium sp. X23]
MENKIQILYQIIDNIENVIVGKRHSIELMIISLICGGHVLIEDVPGVGKTTMVSSLAKSLSLDFKRVQFTPDILPSDITGLTIYDAKTGLFQYHPGAVMTNILLADEINRTTPKTQSSLLEVMEEKQVSVDGNTHKLPNPFMVLATQNPIEYIGTFPLPEAQLDRFFMKIRIGYPDYQEEIKILERFHSDDPLHKLQSVADAEVIISLQQQVRKVYVDQSINRYIVDIIRATRNHHDIELGVSPRGSLALLHASQAWALYQGRDYVIPDDVKRMAAPVLGHRLIAKPEVSLKYGDEMDVLEAILSAVDVPIAD